MKHITVSTNKRFLELRVANPSYGWGKLKELPSEVES